MAISSEQHLICKRYSVLPFDAPFEQKVGIALNVKIENLYPINGLRHLPEGDTTGWYIWAGDDFSNSPDFFVPLHVEHILHWRPEILKYLALPPGYRFLLGKDGYEDIWFDESLLDM